VLYRECLWVVVDLKSYRNSLNEWVAKWKPQPLRNSITVKNSRAIDNLRTSKVKPETRCGKPLVCMPKVAHTQTFWVLNVSKKISNFEIHNHSRNPCSLWKILAPFEKYIRNNVFYFILLDFHREPIRKRYLYTKQISEACTRVLFNDSDTAWLIHWQHSQSRPIVGQLEPSELSAINDNR